MREHNVRACLEIVKYLQHVVVNEKHMFCDSEIAATMLTIIYSIFSFFGEVEFKT